VDPLQNKSLPLSFEGEGDTGGEVDKITPRMLVGGVVEWIKIGFAKK
jgi:hypothetical protein